MTEALSDQEWSTLRLQIPPELDGYEPELRRFFDAMIYKLRRNAHKGKWEDVPIGRALELLDAEGEELHTVLAFGNTSEILMEAADVANMALIAANIAMEARDARSINVLRWRPTGRGASWAVGRISSKGMEFLPDHDGGMMLFDTEQAAAKEAARQNEDYE